MKRDESIYTTATSAALAGLGVQCLLCLATGTVGAWAESPAILAATWHIAGGIPIWIILAIIYQQHRLERTESLAAEKLATQDAASAALFGDVSDELQLIRSRLERLYNLGLPIVSFTIAIYLIAAGAGMLYRAAMLQDDPVALSLAKDCNPVGLMFATAGIAFVAFIAARWVSGYTRIREWQLLRGGASYLMSTFVIGMLLLAGAATVAIVEETFFFRLLARLVPSLMILVGSEILVTALLAAYRPRRPGEVPRPAFDSRVLGLLTAPESLGQVVGELINYQFGVEVSGSWFYQMLGKAMTPLSIFGGLVLLALSTLVIVGPEEQGVIMRFGQLQGGAVGPGIHLKAPWPIETSAVYPTGKVLQLTITSDRLGRLQNRGENALLWTSSDDDDTSKMGLDYFLCASRGLDSTTAMSLAVAEVIVQYRIGDLIKFLEASTEPRASIEMVTQQEASRYFASRTIDELLSRGRTEGGPQLERDIQRRIDQLGLGFEIVDVAITTLQPPGKVAREFHRQIGVAQYRETLIQRAEKEAIVTLVKVAGSVDRSSGINDAIVELDRRRAAVADAEGSESQREAAIRSLAQQELQIETLLGDARGEAAEIIHKARAYRWSRAIGERSALERFAGQLLAYRASPAYFRTRYYLDILAAGLDGQRKVVIAGDHADLPVLDLDFSEESNAIDTLISE